MELGEDLYFEIKKTLNMNLYFENIEILDDRISTKLNISIENEVWRKQLTIRPATTTLS